MSHISILYSCYLKGSSLAPLKQTKEHCKYQCPSFAPWAHRNRRQFHVPEHTFVETSPPYKHNKSPAADQPYNKQVSFNSTEKIGVSIGSVKSQSFNWTLPSPMSWSLSPRVQCCLKQLLHPPAFLSQCWWEEQTTHRREHFLFCTVILFCSKIHVVYKI